MVTDAGPSETSEGSAVSYVGLRRWGATLIALLICGLLVASLLIAPGLRETLRDALRPEDRGWLVCTELFTAAMVILLLTPGAAADWLWQRTGKPSLRWASWALLFFGALYALADDAIYLRFGRHLKDLVAYLMLPEGQAAGGDLGANLKLLSVVSAWSLVSVAAFIALRRGVAHLLFRVRPIFAILCTLLGGISLILLGASPWYLSPLAPDGFRPRLSASLPFRPGVPFVDQRSIPRDPSLARLQEALQTEYERLFSHVYRPHEERPADTSDARDNPPDIAIIVAESLRWEQLTPERMPRLFEWSKRGLRAEQHYAGSNHSESGLFILLYGEHPLRFNTTLNQKKEPTLCRLLRAADYRCGYYTGHPKVWLRREEFLNPQTMDDFVHDDSGTWNDWDERALKNAAVHLGDARRRLTLTFLMSSHFEYRYPDKYRIHVPDDPPATGWLPGQTKPEEFESCRNRYMNVTAYLDDLVADHLEGLDPEKTLVIFTGDHGEATGENGRFGHGYSFSDPLSRVPFVMVGPGIEPEVRSKRSSHLDVVPTLLKAVGIGFNSESLGAPLQGDPPERPLLSSYTTVGRPYADSLLLHEDLRLSLRLYPEQARVEVLGFEARDGQALQVQPTADQTESLVAAFVDRLTRAGKPVSPTQRKSAPD